MGVRMWSGPMTWSLVLPKLARLVSLLGKISKITPMGVISHFGDHFRLFSDYIYHHVTYLHTSKTCGPKGCLRKWGNGLSPRNGWQDRWLALMFWMGKRLLILELKGSSTVWLFVRYMDLLEFLFFFFKDQLELTGYYQFWSILEFKKR